MPLYAKPHDLPTPVWLTDDDVARVELNRPRWCHHVLFLHNSVFWLGNRAEGRTQPGAWFIGGRVKIFTDVVDSLAQTVFRETKLTIKKNRFRHIGQNRYFFDGADGGPANDAVAEIFSVDLTDSEIVLAELDPHEYSSAKLRPYDWPDIQVLPDEMAIKVFSDLWRQLSPF